jgi:uncharacterized protein (TIGR03083 family)
LTAAEHRHVIAALRRSHDRLVSLVESLPPGGVTAPSYCDDWKIAQVLSHLGSGAEISLLGLNAVLAGDPPPERERYLEIWAKWDALEPDAMAEQAILTDQQHVSRFEDLDDAALEALAMPSFDGRILDASGAVAMRLSEHALHTWDIEVMGDEQAVLSASAVAVLTPLISDRIGRLARGPKPELAPTAVAVEATDPATALTIEIGDEVVVGDSGDATTTLVIPSEALFRLINGRMDSGHTPESVAITGSLRLDDLRALFPGF